MHAAGVEFDDAFFVGQAAESDRVVVGIVFRALHHADAGLERVAATFQERIGRFDVGISVVGADDDGALGRILFGRVALLAVFGERFRDG